MIKFVKKKSFKSKVWMIVFISIILFIPSCSKNINYDVFGSKKNIFYDSYLTDTYFINQEYDLQRPKYCKPHFENEDEYYFSKETFEYIKQHIEDYICYNIEVTISNKGKCDIYGYKFELAKDYGMSLVIYEVFEVEAYEVWKPGETYDVYIPIFIDKSKFSENDINTILNDLSLLFTYESVDYPTQKIDDFFGRVSDSRCVGINTITIR